MITLSENFRAVFYTPFYAAHVTGAYAAEGVDVRMRESPAPGLAARALEAGDVDVMWGGPLRVLLTHDADPASDVVCFCDVVARDPFFVIGRTPRPDFRPSDLRHIDPLALPAGRHQARRRRSRQRAARHRRHDATEHRRPAFG